MTVAGEISYYLRPVNGDDSNDGTSFATAWKTWSKCMELCGTTGATAGGAALFLVNEGGAYTGPYHSGLGESSTVDYYFTTRGGWAFQICGLSADGTYDPNTNFEFDLSGFTGQNWLYAFGGPSDIGILFKNITWKNATTATNAIVWSDYDDALSRSVFSNCIFQDNELNNAIFGNGGSSARITYENCKFIRNNTYDTSHSMFSAYRTTANSRGNGGDFLNCVFDSNQTAATSSPLIYGAAATTSNFVNCAFYNNGYDTNSICIHSFGSNYYDEHKIKNCVFFNNAGTAIYIPNTNATDAVYANSPYNLNISENVFAYNNKSLDIVNEPGLRFLNTNRNVFYNNTVEDIPDIIETIPGISGGNFIFDPEFNNGYSGDFSVPHDSRLFTKSSIEGIPIGGSFVQKRSFRTIQSGSFNAATGEVGDTIVTSGKSYQLVQENPRVWRRYITQPPLTGVFSPSSLSSLYGWYDASTDVVVSGTDVSSWTDKSGNGNDLVSITEPTLVSSAQNGLDVIRFVTGTEDLDNSSISGNLSNFNFYFVFKPDLPVGDTTFVPIAPVEPYYSGNYHYILATWDTTSSNFNGNAGSGPFTYSLDGSAFYPAVRRDLYNAFVVDSGYHIVGGFNFNISGWPNPWGIGKWSTTVSTDNFIGDFAEIITLDSTPSDADKRKIEGYLAHKWGLASKLPSNHPFKNYAP